MKFLQIAMFLRLRTRGFLVRVKNHAKGLLDSGAISQAEFDSIKQKTLA